MNDFWIKKNDRLPVLRANLSDSVGYVDLTSATAYFIYQNRTRATPPVTGNATILGASSGYIEYAWGTGDVSTPGSYYAEWRAIMANGKQMSFPNESFISFQIVDSL